MAVIALGILAILVNLDQPLVRNSLVYARVAEHLLAHGCNPLPVIADSRLSYDKPIGFSWSAAPLVAWYGTHIGLMLASAIGVIAMVAAALQLLRTVLPDPEQAPLRARALLFGTLSPMVVYQTWSAHPDALETAPPQGGDDRARHQHPRADPGARRSGAGAAGAAPAGAARGE
ncbi:MAG: hypothetical protein IPK26_13915 [Planctomycetes bacterium]|nr:hypothetical protein [Planctomycetota bacterium]